MNRKPKIEKTYINKILSKLTRVLSILLIVLVTLTGCSNSGNSGIVSIDMREVGDIAQEYDKSISENVKLTLKDRFERHYQNGLYFEDLSKYQDELNQKFKEYYTKKVEDYIKENNLDTTNWTFFFASDIEFVKQDVKKYANGELSAEDIFLNPDSIFSMESYFVVIVDTEKYGEEKKYLKSKGEETGLNKLDKYLPELFFKKYRESGIPYSYLRYLVYDSSVLDKYTIEELRNTKDFQKVNSTFNVEDQYFLDEPHKILFKRLKTKYNKDFYLRSDNYYAPKDNPDLYFTAYWTDAEDMSKEIKDYFSGIMYQYELNKYLQKIIDDMGLSDRVGFLVTSDTNLTTPHNFGDGYDSLEYVKNEYNGDINVTLIYLKKLGDKIDFDSLQKLVYKVDEFIGLGEHKINRKIPEVGNIIELRIRRVYVYFFNIDDYGKKVALDLLKKYQITERDGDKNVLGLADVFSLSQTTRAETPAFHYLDIFAESSRIYSEFNRDPSEDTIDDEGNIFNTDENDYR